MKTATLILTLIGFTTPYAYSQAAAGYGGAAATAATTAAGAAGGLGRAEGTALSRVGSATGNATGGSASPTTTQVIRTTPSAMRVRRISVELTQNLNSKEAKIGDEVIARTTSAAMLANGVRLPVGTRLIGKVTEAQVDSPGHLAFAFHRIVLGDGRQIAIRATLDSISAPLVVAASAPIRVTGAEGSVVYGSGGAVAHGSGGNAAALSSLSGITAGTSVTSSIILDAKDGDVVLSRGTQMMLTVATH